ncbi:putative rmlC-like cupin domain superfamily, cysteine oxygenase/2-aminoethanethiol dioxygenase [Helianthus annuus]|nr:putative rmlC-like cupin domain superfamily, cysteine oxygenase/2-aminoethanethiol dioxygenase [Helianthus annuus]
MAGGVNWSVDEIRLKDYDPSTGSSTLIQGSSSYGSQLTQSAAYSQFREPYDITEFNRTGSWSYTQGIEEIGGSPNSDFGGSTNSDFGGSPNLEIDQILRSLEEELLGSGTVRGVDWSEDEIRLKDYDLSQMPDIPICPFLVKLFLQVPHLTVIPPTFFEHMPVLQVLDISNTNIVSLPTSISSLSLLQEFILRDCSALIELPTQIGMLLNLKLFDIQGTQLMFLPKEMGKLKNLEILRVSLSEYAKDYVKSSVNETVIPRKMISELKKLKELCVIISVGPEPEWWEEEVKYIQSELCDLENLETLRWYLPTTEVLQQFLLLERNRVPMYANLSNLMLTIGQHAQLTSCLPHGLEEKFEEFKNCLKWINAEGSMDAISKIMASAEALFLSRHWTIRKLSTFNVTKLKYCLLAECNEMETVVEVDGLSEDVETRIKNGEKVGFELLQYLSIHYMNKLQSIWKGPIGKDSLSKLRILSLHTCPKLTSIFTLTIAQNLSCLAELTVEDCPKVTSLISNKSHNIKLGLVLPTLEKIFLLDLPVLVNIFVGRIMLENLRTMLIYSCPRFRDLSNMELPRIKKIEGEDEWWKALDCDKSPWKNIFVQLKKRRALIEQLSEATNSLQHFHDILSHGERKKGRTKHKVAAVQKLYDACRDVFANCGPGVVPDAQGIERLKDILNGMTEHDVGVRPNMPFFKVKETEGFPKITYLHLSECDKFSIGIFLLPPTGVLPLHNHPQMTVFSKLLFGTMHIKAYDWVDNIASSSAPKSDSSECEETAEEKTVSVRLAKLKVNSDFTAPCNTSILYPYCDAEGRHCQYYRTHPFTSFSAGDNKQLPGDDEKAKELDYAWLEEIDKPAGLSVVGAPYNGPRIVEK